DARAVAAPPCAVPPQLAPLCEKSWRRPGVLCCSPPTMRRLVSTLAVLLVPAVASAHIRITSPTPRTAELKQRHCGLTGSARANVQTYRPGALLHLVWDEYVSHPGWFRVSFPQNGDTFH